VACYPDRLLELVERWIRSGRAQRIVATVKLQGSWNPHQTAGFLNLPGAKLVHLFHNKHELTFFWSADPANDPNPDP
jgi:23S rRNA (cytidine2498-2'-O)-methyltransferase